MNVLEDKDLRVALSRREARRPKTEVPADFCDGIMQEIAPKKVRPMLWRWMSAAAAILLLIGVGMTVIQKETGVRRQDSGVRRQKSGFRRQESVQRLCIRRTSRMNRQ